MLVFSVHNGRWRGALWLSEHEHGGRRQHRQGEHAGPSESLGPTSGDPGMDRFFAVAGYFSNPLYLLSELKLIVV